MDVGREPVPFETYEPGVYLHGTKAELAVGDLLVSGRVSNFEVGRTMNYVYFTATLDAATWGAELAVGEGRGRIYLVEPTGEFEDDPTSPTRSSPETRHSPSVAEIRCGSSVSSWLGPGIRPNSCR